MLHDFNSRARTVSPKAREALGYKNSVTDIISQLKKSALINNDALIKCTSGQQKVVAPNIATGSYASYDTYLQSLSTYCRRSIRWFSSDSK